MTNQDFIKTMKKEYEKRSADKKSNISVNLVYSFLKECEDLLILDFIKIHYNDADIAEIIENIKEKFTKLLSKSGLTFNDEKCDLFLSKFPSMRESIFGSARRILEGDPASNSIEEIVLTYPGFSAIMAYRIANTLYQMGLNYIARIITEKAHKETGIDINPGATIGENFFIDHGTGIVIGETAVIGNNVKLYQGVTIGAKSLEKGSFLKGCRRHPTIGDEVTIYSNATILGGDTHIGNGSTIGANVFLTTSIPSNTFVYLSDTGIKIVPKQTKVKHN